jgi:hypothetical protein
MPNSNFSYSLPSSRFNMSFGNTYAAPSGFSGNFYYPQMSFGGYGYGYGGGGFGGYWGP